MTDLSLREYLTASTIFAKNSTTNIWKGSKYASEDTPSAMEKSFWLDNELTMKLVSLENNCLQAWSDLLNHLLNFLINVTTYQSLDIDLLIYKCLVAYINAICECWAIVKFLCAEFETAFLKQTYLCIAMWFSNLMSKFVFSYDIMSYIRGVFRTLSNI